MFPISKRQQVIKIYRLPQRPIKRIIKSWKWLLTIPASVIGLGAICLALLIITIMLLANNEPTPVPTPTKFVQKTYTSTKLQLTWTKGLIPVKVDCTYWEKITGDDVGKTMCVYGRIIKIYPAGSYDQIIRFSDLAGTFYIYGVAPSVYSGIEPGQCMSATGTVLIDASSFKNGYASYQPLIGIFLAAHNY